MSSWGNADVLASRHAEVDAKARVARPIDGTLLSISQLLSRQSQWMMVKDGRVWAVGLGPNLDQVGRH